MPSPREQKPQRDRFIEMARELECDEDEGLVNETLKRIALKKDQGPPFKTDRDS